MTTDPREYQRYDYKNSPSKKWPQRKKAIAISMVTCLFLGIIGYEIVREKETVPEAHNAQAQIFSQPMHYDEDLILRYNESLAKIKELKKLLFLQKNPAPHSKITELTKQLEERETLLKELRDSLAVEKEKTHILDLALANLTHLIEVQRLSNETIVQNLRIENERLTASHLTEEDLLTTNFEQHLSKKEAEALVLREKFEKEKADLLATYEGQLLKERQAAEALAKSIEAQKETLRLASENEKQEFLAAFEQKLLEKEEVIKKLYSHQEGLEEFFALKEQALQATESAWKDYALDLSQEIQGIEKRLAEKVETQQQLEQELATMIHQLAKAEKATLGLEVFSQAAKKDFEKLAEQYNQLEENHHIHRFLTTYQHEDVGQSYATTLQELTKQIEALKEEVFVINEALEREIKVGESLFNEKTSYLSLNQELQNKIELSDNHTKELENQLELLSLQLGQKSSELEELERIANMQLALASHHAKEELAKTKAESEALIEQHMASLQHEKREKNNLEQDLITFQEQYELLTARAEKTDAEISALKAEKEKLEKNLEEQALAFTSYKAKYLEEFEINLLATKHLTSQLQSALIANEDLQSVLLTHQTTSSQELLAQKALVEQLEEQLKENVAKAEDLKKQITEASNHYEKEIATQQTLVKELEDRLSASLAKNEELTHQTILVKEDYEQKLSSQQLLVNQLEEQLKDNLAVKEELQKSFEQNQLALTGDLNNYAASIIDLEILLKKSYSKQDELQNKLEDTRISFELAKQETDENKALVSQIADQLQTALLKNEESHLTAQQEKQKLLDEIQQQQILTQNLEGQLNSSRADYEHIQQQLFSTEVKSHNRINEQERLIAQLENQVEELKTVLALNESEHQAIAGKLEDELAKNKLTVQQITETYAATQKEYEAIQVQLKETTDSFDTERARLLKDSESYRMAALDLGSKLEETLASNHTLNQLLKAEEQQSEMTQQEFEAKLRLLALDSQEEQLKISHLEKDLKAIKEDYENHLVASRSEIDRLSQELIQMTAKAEEADRYLLTYQSTIDDAQALYKSRIEDLKIQNEALSKDLGIAQSENIRFRESMGAEKSLLEQQIVKLQEDFSSLNVAKQLLQEQLEVQFLTAQQLQQQKELLDQQMAKSEKMLAQREEAITHHQREIETLKEQLEDSLALKADLEKNVQYIQQLSDVLAQKEQEFQEAVTNVHRLQEELVQKNTSYDALNLLFVKQQKATEELKQSLEKEVEKNNKMTSDMSTLQNHIQEKEQLLIEITERGKLLKEAGVEEKISALEN
ncbi:MAG: hypothetical protein ACSNEK_01540 [Parachlamydiaceae bacterium]